MKRDKLLDYNDFKRLALRSDLSRHEKIDGSDLVREGYSEVIIDDIVKKIPQIIETGNNIVDIGCGCDDLGMELVHRIIAKNNELFLLDSAEMLALMPNHDKIHKIPGEFPEEDIAFIESRRGTMNAVLVYSVLQYICAHGNIFNFIDSAVELLVPGGSLLLGDLPNRSKRRRFFISNDGIRTHQNFTGTNEIPKVNPWELEYGQLDDSIIFAILQRYRNGGYETYLLPQNEKLPFATRREDILIVKRN